MKVHSEKRQIHLFSSSDDRQSHMTWTFTPRYFSALFTGPEACVHFPQTHTLPCRSRLEVMWFWLFWAPHLRPVSFTLCVTAYTHILLFFKTMYLTLLLTCSGWCLTDWQQVIIKERESERDKNKWREQCHLVLTGLQFIKRAQ